jgi:hypothetical protein
MSQQRIVPGGNIETVTPGELSKLLADFNRAGHVAWGSGSIEKKMENWPVMGHHRQIRVNTAKGNNNLPVPANVYTDLFPLNLGRGGLSIINIGANPCFIFLATATDAQELNGAVASGYIASDGSWDGRIGHAQWCGAVSVLSVLGTTLVVAEL